MNRFKLLSITFLGSLVVCGIFSGLYLWQRPLTPKIVKVNIQSILKQEASRISARRGTPAQEQAALDQVMIRLNRVLQDQGPQMIILDVRAVISPHVPDLTEEIRGQLLKGQGEQP